MRLNEIKRIPPEDDRGFYTDPADIKAWCVTYGQVSDSEFDKFATIHPDGTVDYDTHIWFDGGRYRQKLKRLKVKFGTINGEFSCFNHALETMEGCPHTVKAAFVVRDNKLTSLEYAPKYARTMYLRNNPIRSLVKISDNIKSTETIQISFEGPRYEITEGGIGLILIDKLGKILGYNELARKPTPWTIISKYLGKPEMIYDCQEELIENGFEAYAQL